VTYENIACLWDEISPFHWVMFSEGGGGADGVFEMTEPPSCVKDQWNLCLCSYF
jgi:hypothetical protein